MNWSFLFLILLFCFLSNAYIMLRLKLPRDDQSVRRFTTYCVRFVLMRYSTRAGVGLLPFKKQFVLEIQNEMVKSNWTYLHRQRERGNRSNFNIKIYSNELINYWSNKCWRILGWNNNICINQESHFDCNTKIEFDRSNQ